MKKILSLLIFALFVLPLFAQDDDYPVGYTFETSMLMDNQTVMTPYKGMREFGIQHRFGLVTDGLDNLFGIYSPSNIRLGLNYGLTDYIMIGAGTTKDYKLQDFHLKYAFLRQTESGKVPVTIAYYGNVVLDARPDDSFGPAANYRFIHRFSYFTQVIVARKFSDAFSMQVAPTAIYYNSVERGNNNFNYGIHAGGRFAFGMNSIIFEYNQLLTPQEDEEMQPKPQLAIGWERGTATHAFQLFFANYKGIVAQQNFLYNMNDLTEGEFLVGMNITVRF